MKANLEEIPLVIDEPIQDIFTSGIARIDSLGGGCYRFILYTLNYPLDGGEPERIVTARIIAARPAMVDAVQQILNVLGATATDGVVRLISH